MNRSQLYCQACQELRRYRHGPSHTPPMAKFTNEGGGNFIKENEGWKKGQLGTYLFDDLTRDANAALGHCDRGAPCRRSPCLPHHRRDHHLLDLRRHRHARGRGHDWSSGRGHHWNLQQSVNKFDSIHKKICMKYNHPYLSDYLFGLDDLCRGAGGTRRRCGASLFVRLRYKTMFIFQYRETIHVVPHLLLTS